MCAHNRARALRELTAPSGHARRMKEGGGVAGAKRTESELRFILNFLMKNYRWSCLFVLLSPNKEKIIFSSHTLNDVKKIYIKF